MRKYLFSGGVYGRDFGMSMNKSPSLEFIERGVRNPDG